MQLVDAMVKRTEGQLNESAELLQEILKAAADERGEWQLPLSAEKQAAMRRVRGVGMAAGQAGVLTCLSVLGHDSVDVPEARRIGFRLVLEHWRRRMAQEGGCM